MSGLGFTGLAFQGLGFQGFGLKCLAFSWFGISGFRASQYRTRPFPFVFCLCWEGRSAMAAVAPSTSGVGGGFRV